MAKPRKIIDWEAIKREYKAGQLSVREIASQFDCSHTGIQKKAKKNGWKRNLIKDVKKEVARKTVARVANLNDTATDDEIIEAAAERGAEVESVHRKDIQQSQSLVRLLQGQLIEAATNRDEIEDSIYDETKGKDGSPTQTKKRNRMLRAVSLPAHATVLRDLSVAQKNLIYLERQAWNLNESADGETIEDALRKIFESGK